MMLGLVAEAILALVWLQLMRLEAGASTHSAASAAFVAIVVVAAVIVVIVGHNCD